MGFIVSPFLSPLIFGFVVARTRYVGISRTVSCSSLVPQLEVGIREWMFLWPFDPFVDCFIYGRDVSYQWISLLFIFLKPWSTRLYDRTLKPIPELPSTGLRYRIETLVGKTGIKMAKYRSSWYEAIMSPFEVVWRPHFLGALIFEVCYHLFSNKIN